MELMDMKNKNPITAIIIGAGHRAIQYARYSEKYPENLRIVGVADPDANRRKETAKIFNLSDSQCFYSATEVAEKNKMSDVIINGTMDRQHVPTSLPLIEKGYDILLEKPIATNKRDMLKLVEANKKFERKIMICHVLRYAPFYTAIKEKVISGEIGTIVNIQTTEHVCHHHFSTAFIRGKWNNHEKCGSSMLMQKSCHDLDIILWMKSGAFPKYVSSFGSLMNFKPENAPKHSGTKCLVDCIMEKECPYSAYKQYIDHPERWGAYVWASIENIKNPTIRQKIESLKNDNPHGRCVWKCDNNVVDHQSIIIEFEDGATATHNMIGGTAKPERSIHIIGTQGEIRGIFKEGNFSVYHIDPKSEEGYKSKNISLNIAGDTEGAFGGHGGGDERLVEDFINYIKGKQNPLTCTCLEDSIYGHLIGFAADQAMMGKKVVKIDKII